MKHTIITFIAIALLSDAYAQEKEPTFSNFQLEDTKILHQRMYAEETQCHDVTFTTTGAWTSSFSSGYEPPWVSISPDCGNAAGTYTVSVTMEANKTGEDRWESIVIFCNGERMDIAIYQDGNSTPGRANDIFVSGGDVYIAGYEGHYATLWKNGEAQHLTDGLDDARAFSVYVSDDDVYVAGMENRCVMLWKNGAGQRLTDGSKGVWTESVFVSGSDVFVCGEEYNEKNNYIAKIWKNGKAQELSNGEHSAYATSIFVSGGDVYVSGYDKNEKGCHMAVLWKNGEAQYLTDGNHNAGAHSVYVSDGIVYVAGESDGDVAVFWENGKIHYLTYVPSRDEDEGYDDDYDDSYDEDREYNTINELREYIEKGNIKALSDYISFLTPEQQVETEIDFAYDKINTVLALVMETERYDLFGRLMKNETEAKRWANEFLYASAGSGNVEAVKYLVSKGANINRANANGYTPVIAALENNRMEVVEYLINLGANLNLMVSQYYPNESHKTPLLFKYYYQNRNARGYYDENYILLRRLIEAGADVDTKYYNGKTLLFEAGYEDLKLATYLIRHGADVNAKDDEGKTPVFSTSLEKIKLLVDNKADVNATDNNGETPLSYALSNYAEDDLLKYLIEKGANVNHKDKNGYTPLHIAAKRNLGGVKLLVESGADIHAKDNDGHTPIYHTDGSSSVGKGIIEYLKSKGADDKDAGIGGWFNIEFSM